MKLTIHKSGQRRWYVAKHIPTGKRTISFWDNPPEKELYPIGEFIWSQPFSSQERAELCAILNPDKP